MIDNNSHIIANDDISIDISLLFQISGNDEVFINTMVRTFLKTMPETLEKLEKNLDAKDWENVYRSAHFAKSSLSVIKIIDMLDLVVQVEVNAKNEAGLEGLPNLVQKIKQKYLLAEKILRERFE
jgi:HPt (histidine-containing phosphotransfer) domain-containing protein